MTKLLSHLYILLVALCPGCLPFPALMWGKERGDVRMARGQAHQITLSLGSIA